MSQDAPIPLSPDQVLAISDALVTVEQHLMRYHGCRIQLDPEPFKANFAPDFRRLLRAKRLLSRELTAADRRAIVAALDYANIAIALHDGAPLLDTQPAVTMGFGNAGLLVQEALRILAATS